MANHSALDGPCTGTTMLRVPPELYVRARRVAAAEERTFAALVRHLLRQHVESVEKKQRQQTIEVVEEERKTA
jgi:hypothetical protein